MTLLDRYLDRATRRREERITNGDHYRDDVDALGGVMGNLDTEYRIAAKRGADRQELGRILEALGGCEVATAYLYRAMGWDKTAPGHAEHTRLSGLLLLELSRCAAEGTEWRGVRHQEFEPVWRELRNVALVYAGWAPNPHGNLGDPDTPITVGRRLENLMDALRGVVPGQPTETLAVLAGVHGGDPR